MFWDQTKRAEADGCGQKSLLEAGRGALCAGVRGGFHEQLERSQQSRSKEERRRLTRLVEKNFDKEMKKEMARAPKG